jgi:hypothetical protein
LISLRGKDAIAAICKVPKSDDEEVLEDGMEASEGASESDTSAEEGQAPAEEGGDEA